MNQFTKPAPFGALRPGRLDSLVLAATTALPDTWLGLRMAILLRRLVTMRLSGRQPAALDVDRWGLAMRLHPLDNGCEKNLLFTPKMYEPAELAALEEAIEATRGRRFVFVDIGANVGLFSLFVAANAGPDARIVAIEPEPGNMARLTFNLGANKTLPIRPLALAVGDEECEVAISLNRRDRGGTRAHAVTATDAGDLVRVPCRPLLSVLREEGLMAVDALKIDVEGMEDRVLAPFFRDAPPELWPRLVLIEDSSHEWHTDLFKLLAEKGYTVSTRSKQNVVLRR
ncbi:MAG TPA: FkbM family methyltransferase [Xanthobacteraceae bacterium]|nr:FkbM family methyltransferase [Xanthobacteraceae bacterium]